MNEINLKVEGMHCAGCENRVKNVLLDVKNILDVNADSKTGYVTIKSKEKIDLNEVKELIENLGFSVVKED